MVDAGIHPGDYVVIRKHAEIGDIVVALDQGINNLKVLGFDTKKQAHFLRSCNKDKERYASEIIIQKTRAALILLCNLEHLEICGRRYDQGFICCLMTTEMMSEDISQAISYYVNRVKEKTIPRLSIAWFAAFT